MAFWEPESGSYEERSVDGWLHGNTNSSCWHSFSDPNSRHPRDLGVAVHMLSPQSWVDKLHKLYLPNEGLGFISVPPFLVHAVIALELVLMLAGPVRGAPHDLRRLGRIWPLPGPSRGDSGSCFSLRAVAGVPRAPPHPPSPRTTSASACCPTTPTHTPPPARPAFNPPVSARRRGRSSPRCPHAPVRVSLSAIRRFHLPSRTPPPVKATTPTPSKSQTRSATCPKGLQRPDRLQRPARRRGRVFRQRIDR